MKLNVYEGRFENGRRVVYTNNDILLYAFDYPHWGFVGTGATRVAEAVICNEFGRQADNALINRFLTEKVAKWPGREGWTITSEELQEWKEKEVVR